MKPTVGEGIKPVFIVVALAFLTMLRAHAAAQIPPHPNQQPAIPIDQIGAVAGKNYSGDGLSVQARDGGAILRCAFQRLDAEVSHEGLWLRSTVTGQPEDRFRIKAIAVGSEVLNDQGDVSVEGGTVRFTRKGLLEEYRVGIDGVRQDYVVQNRSHTSAGLIVHLQVDGGVVAKSIHGVELALQKSGRKIAYSRLRVTDATGKQLPARFELPSSPSRCTPHREFALRVIVDEAGACYPIRIDPTFSDANWINMGGTPGSNRKISATAVDDAGNLYAGGQFSLIGDTNAFFVAKWDGNSWSALGSGIDSPVQALCVMGNDLYAGGGFSTAGGVSVNNVARWDGSNWSSLGSGVDGLVRALTASGTNLFVAGDFIRAGNNTANHIARWDGTGWYSLGSGLNSLVSALAASGTNVYAGGYFSSVGSYVARWNGSSWSPLGSGLNAPVFALAVMGSDLYAGGQFSTAGGNLAAYVAKWNGSSWSALGSGMNAPVLAIAIMGDNLYAGGYFSNAGNVPANYVAKWDGNSWGSLGSGMSGFVESLAVFGEDLYAGGEFLSAGEVRANHVAKWSGGLWRTLGSGSGLSGEVYALAASGNDLYVGGNFKLAGGVSVNSIAKWDGVAWEALGPGLSAVNGFVPTVLAIAVSGSNVYAGGLFSHAGVTPAKGIARWDGHTWDALGSGVNLENPNAPVFVYALAVSGTSLYAGGDFTIAGGVVAGRVAKWDGRAWSALGLGLGVDDIVYALAASGSNVYVGGRFTSAAGISVNHIALWNGSRWNALGSGVNNTVAALQVSGNDVYAGGSFTAAGGVPANRIAKWNGSSWSSLGLGMNESVAAIALVDGDVYAGGQFTMADGLPANYIARWSGSSWNALGSGLNNAVRSLTPIPSGMYLGGGFTLAGGKPSFYLAKAVPSGDPPQIIDPPLSQTRTVNAMALFHIEASGGAPLTYQWRRNGETLTNGVNRAGATAATLTISNVQPADAGIYSVVVSNAYGSVTSRVATLTISLPGEMLTLSDYFPLPLDAEWLYDGTDWDGVPAKTRNHVSSVNANITLFTGRSPAVAYVTNCIQLSAAYLDRTTMIPYDTWEDYLAIGEQFGQFGDDDLPKESLRVDGGGIFPARMAVGGSATNVADAYLSGSFVGVMTNILEVLERTSLLVPAGHFPDVLRVRMTFRFPGGTQVHDQWWARWIGKIKRQGVSGGGASHHFELISYSVPLPLSIIVNDGSAGFVSNGFGFKILGQAGLSVVAETSSNLVHWLPLQTNTLGAEALHFIDPDLGNVPRRFYRARSR